MITRYLTHVSTRFNPFSRPGKLSRLFLAQLPSNLRARLKVDIQQIPKDSTEQGFLKVKFKDGKEMTFDVQKMGIKDVSEEVDRHARMLRRQEELSGS